MPDNATPSGGPSGSMSPGVLSGNVVTTPELSQGLSPSPQPGNISAGTTTTFQPTPTIQTFTAPETGTYDILAFGAQGGNTDFNGSKSPGIGGKGAEIGGDFQLTKGETLSIIVGTVGQLSVTHAGAGGGGGGGGGSFVYLVSGSSDAPELLLAAGGGGGAGINPEN